MAHEIDQTTGKDAVFTAFTPAWHKLGITIDHAADSAEAMKLACMEYTVNKEPIYTKVDTEYHVVPHRYALVRSDTHKALSVMSDSYRVFQPSECFDFMDALVSEKLAMYESAGVLREGRKLWILARIPKEYRIGKEDQLKPYTLLLNSYDGTGALNLFDTVVRTVCMNTVRSALRSRKNGEGINIPHWPNLAGKVELAREKLGILVQNMDEFHECAIAMAGKQLTSALLKGYFETLFPTSGEKLSEATIKENKAAHAQCMVNYDNDRNILPGIKHTVWSALNSVTEWSDWQRKVRGKAGMAGDNHLNSIWFGPADKVKHQAFEAAMALVG